VNIGYHNIKGFSTQQSSRLLAIVEKNYPEAIVQWAQQSLCSLRYSWIIVNKENFFHICTSLSISDILKIVHYYYNIINQKLILKTGRIAFFHLLLTYPLQYAQHFKKYPRDAPIGVKSK
jgi:hypothetical protein